MCGLCFLLWAILWPLSQPSTLRPPLQDPGVDRAWRDPHALSSQPCATGALAPSTLTRHIQFTPSSLTGLPVLPRALPPILPPLGFRDTSTVPPSSHLLQLPILDLLLWPPFLPRTPLGSRQNPPECPPCPPQPLCSLDYGLCVGGSREQRQCLCAGLAGAVGMAKHWALVSWLRAPAARWLSPQQTAVCPTSRSCGDKCLTSHPVSHLHTNLPHPRPSPSCGVQSRPPERDVRVLTSRIYNSSLFGNRVFARVTQLRSHSREGPDARGVSREDRGAGERPQRAVWSGVARSPEARRTASQCQADSGLWPREP